MALWILMLMKNQRKKATKFLSLFRIKRIDFHGKERFPERGCNELEREG